MDEVENDLAPSVPIILAQALSAERLAREPSRNNVSTHVPAPLGPELDRVALRRSGKGVAVGRIVGLDSRAV